MPTSHLERLEKRRLFTFTPFGGDVEVPGTGNAIGLDIAVAGNGSFIVAAVVGDGPEATYGDLIAVRYGADGEQIGDAMTIEHNVSGDAISISADAVGNAVMAYGGASFVLISNDGVVSAPINAAPNGGDYAAVSMAADGDFYVAWSRDDAIDADNGTEYAEVRAFDAQGKPRGDAFIVHGAERSSVAYGGLYGLHVATTPDGSRAVVSLTGWSYSEVDISVNEWFVVDTTHVIGSGFSYGYTQAHDVIVHPDGSSVVAYSSAGGSQIDEYRPSWEFAQRVDAVGEKVGDAIELGAELGASPTRNEIRAATLAAMPDGGFAASFVQKRDDENTLYARRYGASAAPDSSGVIQLGGTSRSPVIGADANGTAVVARIVEATESVQFTRLASDFAFIQQSALYVIGTEGDDSISVTIDGSNVVVHRGAETRTFAAADVGAIVVDGQAGHDSISNETSMKATLRGGDGSDTLFGGSAEDRIHGGKGNDVLWGRDGVDRLYGEDDRDSLYGNGGNDRLEGGAQADHMRGNGGRDKMFGNGGNDRIFGGESGDWIYGQAGYDQLVGEGGADHIYADDGQPDTLRGGAGNDWLISLDSVADAVFGDGGRDSVNGDDADLLTSVEGRL